MGETDTDTEVLAPPLAGYRTPPRYRIVHGGEGTSYEGLWVQVRSNLRGAELDALNDPEQTWLSLEALMAPWVTAWNVVAPVKVKREVPPQAGPDGQPVGTPTHVVTIEEEPLPAPAEAGPAVFRRVDDWVKLWIKAQLAAAPFVRGDETLKPLTGSPATPPGAPGETTPAGGAKPSPKRSRTPDPAPSG